MVGGSKFSHTDISRESHGSTTLIPHTQIFNLICRAYYTENGPEAKAIVQVGNIVLSTELSEEATNTLARLLSDSNPEISFVLSELEVGIGYTKSTPPEGQD
jgi:hypothetical protein